MNITKLKIVLSVYRVDVHPNIILLSNRCAHFPLNASSHKRQVIKYIILLHKILSPDYHINIKSIMLKSNHPHPQITENITYVILQI